MKIVFARTTALLFFALHQANATGQDLTSNAGVDNDGALSAVADTKEIASNTGTRNLLRGGGEIDTSIPDRRGLLKLCTKDRHCSHDEYCAGLACNEKLDDGTYGCVRDGQCKNKCLDFVETNGNQVTVRVSRCGR